MSESVPSAENLAVLKHEAETPMRGHDENGECCLRARLAARAPMSTEHAAEIEALLNADGWIALESSSHLPEKGEIGCICGFCVWSPEHVAVMSYRDGIRTALAYHRASTRVTPPGASA